MENVQMLFPMEPKEFWSHLKIVIEEVVNQKNDSISKPNSVQGLPLKKLLRVKEVYELFHVSKRTIYQWLNQGKLRSIKIESKRYFLWEDIEELIERGGSNSGIMATGNNFSFHPPVFLTERN